MYWTRWLLMLPLVVLLASVAESGDEKKTEDKKDDPIPPRKIVRLDPQLRQAGAEGRQGRDHRPRLHLDRGTRLEQGRQLPGLLRHPQQRRPQVARRQGRLRFRQAVRLHRQDAARRQARR